MHYLSQQDVRVLSGPPPKMILPKITAEKTIANTRNEEYTLRYNTGRACTSISACEALNMLRAEVASAVGNSKNSIVTVQYIRLKSEFSLANGREYMEALRRKNGIRGECNYTWIRDGFASYSPKAEVCEAYGIQHRERFWTALGAVIAEGNNPTCLAVNV